MPNSSGKVELDFRSSTFAFPRSFMDNVQQEFLEIEFNQYSHGMKTVSDVDFTEMLLRYTSFPPAMKRSILRRVRKSSDESSVGRAFVSLAPIHRV